MHTFVRCPRFFKEIAQMSDSHHEGECLGYIPSQHFANHV